MHILVVIAAISLAAQHSGLSLASNTTSIQDVCATISQSISSASVVSFPPSATYQKDVSHWALSSADASVCSVEPGNAADVGKILQILGATRTPFAVKGGGHATNPGFSSTTGVQIAMTRFSEVVYDAGSQTVDVGSGLVWDDVYAQLEPHGVNVVGGRSSGVGVAGFSLGGGYSFLTNQYGLTVDNTIGYELVLPNGTVTSVTEAGSPELFFGLKGGYNNFGIVTRFTYKAHPQGQVWGGNIVIAGDYLPEVSAATAKFSSEVTDPKAAVLPTYDYVQGIPIVSLLMFYDGPTPPAGIFDDYLAIPALAQNISTRPFLSLIQSSVSNVTDETRGTMYTISLTELTPALLYATANETLFWGPRLTNNSAVFVSYDIEPFLSSIFTHGSTVISAYPPDRSRALLPFNIYLAWTDEADDELMKAAAAQSGQQLVSVADAEGQNIADAPLYGNYAGPYIPVGRIFGDSLARMKAAKALYDPDNVMGLAGGWKL